jgi:hypothetical protein
VESMIEIHDMFFSACGQGVADPLG